MEKCVFFQYGEMAKPGHDTQAVCGYCLFCHLLPFAMYSCPYNTLWRRVPGKPVGFCMFVRDQKCKHLYWLLKYSHLLLKTFIHVMGSGEKGKCLCWLWVVSFFCKILLGNLCRFILCPGFYFVYSWEVYIWHCK